MALFPTLVFTLRSGLWWSIPSFVSIDQSLAEITASDPILGRPLSVHNIITFEQKSIQKISLASSVQLSPKIIWDNFGKNWTDFQGGVAKRLLSIYFNTADRRCFGKWQMRHFQNQHNPGNKMTSKVQIWDKISKVKHFFKDRNISRTVGGAVFILLWYVRDMMLMIPTDFCDDMSNGSEDMKMYDKFQNGRQGVQSILA